MITWIHVYVFYMHRHIYVHTYMDGSTLLAYSGDSTLAVRTEPLWCGGRCGCLQELRIAILQLWWTKFCPDPVNLEEDPELQRKMQSGQYSDCSLVRPELSHVFSPYLWKMWDNNTCFKLFNIQMLHSSRKRIHILTKHREQAHLLNELIFTVSWTKVEYYTRYLPGGLDNTVNLWN